MHATFVMKTTRDAEGHARHGQAVVDWTVLDAETIEVQFEDGMWMLCDYDELIVEEPASEW